MSIKLKLIVLAVFSLITITIIGFVLFHNSNTVKKENEKQRIISEIKNKIFEKAIFRDDYLLHREERPVIQLKSASEALSQLLIQASDVFISTDEQATVGRLSENKKFIDQTLSQIIASSRNQNASPSASTKELEQMLISQILIKSQDNIAIASQLADASRKQVTDSQQKATFFVLLFIAYLFLIIMVIFYYVWHFIGEPLIKLKEAALRIAALDFSTTTTTTTTTTTGGGELGELGRAFNQMVVKLRDSQGKVKERTEQLTEKVNALEDNKKAMANLLEDLDVAKKEAETLSQDLEKFKLALDNASDVVVITDPEGIMLYGNKSIEKITGYKPEEVLGKKSGTLWNIPMPQEYYQKMWETIKKQKKTFVGELQNKRKNGDVYTAEIRISPVIDKRGEIIYFVGIERDITREKEIDRQKSEFISLASHQLRTPLTATKWFGEMLLSGDAGKLKGEQEEYIQNIYKSNERMIALVNSLLNISRIESGRLMVNSQPTDLAKLVNEVIDELGMEIKEKKLNLIVSIHPQLPKINIDPKLVRNIYMNLLTNAIKYTPNKGEISVFISKRGNKIISQVSDTGVGIPQKEQSRIFSKFFRGENIIKLQTDGTGLGLYLVKSIVESSKGKIWFSSKGGSASGGESPKNQGTTFWFSLPLSGVPAKKGEVTLES